MPSSKQKHRFSPDLFVSRQCKILAISGLVLYLVFLRHFKHPNCPPKTGSEKESPTNITHLMFGLVSSVKSWKDRRPYIESWWRPNVTRGYLFLDEAPRLPWPSTSPPVRVSDNYSILEQESKHVAPIMIRMVLAIVETFREGRRRSEVGFGGAGIALSYPLAAAMVKDLKGCIRRYPYLISADLITQFCVNEFGISLTVEKGIHQIDLRGDISGFLSSHPQAPLLSLHHFDYVDPIFPSMDSIQSTNHLMMAAKGDQSRLLQQSICYHRQRNWSFLISWGYSAHIYERIYPRSMLKRPLETFKPWIEKSKMAKFLFNTRWPCETPNVFFFESIKRASGNQVFTTYGRSSPPLYPDCPWKGNRFATYVSEIQVLSSATKLIEVSMKHVLYVF
ncbi:fringe-like protein [Actinidia rufa]|uniref:Fringe-like protein n=1 Tax=Actinidia rufa TaxID=165716 RepID=A0A7J0F6T1_9ERIC|nr:fringe-like protein [Actinidia rufa]